MQMDRTPLESIMLRAFHQTRTALLCSPVLLALLAPSANAQGTPPAAEWFSDHNGSREESHGHSILACEDGGFLQIGETLSLIHISEPTRPY